MSQCHHITEERPTYGLRFVDRNVPAIDGVRPVRILQQCWTCTTTADGQTTSRIEWRDVPLVAE